MDYAEFCERISEDFEFFCESTLQVKDKVGQLVLFEWNDAQRYVHERLEDQRRRTGKVRALILKARQQGMSTYIGARFYWRTSTDFGKTAFILTHEQGATDNLFDMVKRYWELSPSRTRPKVSAANAKELSFGKMRSGYKVATAGARATGRSATAQFFHGSEVAFWPSAADHLAGLGQAIPDLPDTEVVLESTANGVGNPFHAMWVAALRGDSEYIPIFIPWFWDLGYRRDLPDGFELDADEIEYRDAYGLTDEQMCWRRLKIASDFAGDRALFDQEYPASADLAFMRSAKSALISPEVVAKARRPKPMFDRGIRVLGVDPAEYGEDSSAIVYRWGRRVVFARRYKGVGTMELAGIVSGLLDELEPDACNVDVTGVGTGVADRLIELQYNKVHRVHFGQRAYDPEKYLNRRAESWARMKDWLLDEPCLLPDDDVLCAELSSVSYNYDSSRRLVLKSKEKMKADGIPSPDSADALALTFSENVAQREPDPPTWRERLHVSRRRGSAMAA